MALERRSVVSVLLFPFDAYLSKPHRLLLFRRSENVRTYRKKLAPIAGSIEPSDISPLSAAWRELKEETGLGPQDVELWRRGPGFGFTDETAVSGGDGKGDKRGRIWQVWPFAFRFKREVAERADEPNKAQLKIDWEHIGHEWRTVDEVLGKDISEECVPRLEVTLSQVWIDPGSDLHQGLEMLRLDHSNGARQLATMAVESLMRLITEDHTSQPQEWWRKFRLQAFHLAFNGRPSMSAAISKAIATALSMVGDTSSLDSDFPGRVRNVLKNHIDKRHEMSRQVGAQFCNFLDHKFDADDQEEHQWIKILTLSSSSTIKAAVLHALDHNENRHIELRILESRPLFEGVSFADFLVQEAQDRRDGQSASLPFHNRLRIVLATDASVGVLSKDVDLVILGADRISEAGDVSNKTGSLPAALTSKHVTNGRAAVICISETDKIASPESLEEHAEEENESREVSESWGLSRQVSEEPSTWQDLVTIRNIYFEWVPAAHIDQYICEDGVLSTTGIRQKSNVTAKLIDQIFSDL